MYVYMCKILVIVLAYLFINIPTVYHTWDIDRTMGPSHELPHTKPLEQAPAESGKGSDPEPIETRARVMVLHCASKIPGSSCLSSTAACRLGCLLLWLDKSFCLLRDMI